MPDHAGAMEWTTIKWKANLSNPQKLRATTFEDLALSNMLTVNAKQDVLERVKRLRTEMTEKRRHH